MHEPICDRIAPSRPPWRRLAAAAAVAAAAAGCLLPTGVAAQPAQAGSAQPTLPRTRLTAGIHVIQAEVAADFDTRARGLMHRERLGPNEGMLFVFERTSGQHCFWMRNTPLPLSIAFIDEAGAIVNVADMQPHSEGSHCPARPVRYALEMEQGWFAKRGLGQGIKVGGLPRP